MLGFGKKRRSRSFEQERESLEIEKLRLGVEERRRNGAILEQAAAIDPVAAAQIAIGRGRKGAALPVQTKSFEKEIVEALVLDSVRHRDEDPADKIARLRRVALEDRALRRALNEDEDDGEEGGGGIGEWILRAAAVLGIAVAPQMAPHIQALMANNLAPATSPPPAQPQPQPAPLPAAHPTLAPEPLAAPAPSGGNVSVFSQMKAGFVLRQLETLSPEDFAAWLAAQGEAADLVAGLIATPDEQLPQLLQDALNEPSVAVWRPVVEWLSAHQEHARAIVAALRQLGQPAASAIVYEEPKPSASGF